MKLVARGIGGAPEVEAVLPKSLQKELSMCFPRGGVLGQRGGVGKRDDHLCFFNPLGSLEQANLPVAIDALDDSRQGLAFRMSNCLAPLDG